MQPKLRPLARRIAGVVAVLLCGAFASAAHSQATRTAAEHPDSRVDIYGGYAFWHPLNSGIDHKQYQDLWNPNATASVSYYFNHFVGIQMEGSYFSGNGEHKTYNPTCSKSMCDQLIYTAEAGPVFRYPLGNWVPFIHLLGGGERTNGPVDQHLFWGWGVTGGFGVDYVVPIWGKHLAVRPIQADYQYSQVVYGPLQLPAGNVGGFGEIDAMKLSAGVVLRFGDKSEPPPLALGCTVNPIAVYAGDPITVTASTMGLDPKKKVDFTWNTNGGRLTPNGAIATIDTTGLQPGEYVVAGHVSQGAKARQQASCEAPFTINKILPPTVTCAASPSTATSGTTIDINTVGTSPQNRPLSYSYSTTGGQIEGSGSTAKLTTAGLGAGTIDVTCNVVDDLGQRATAIAQVQISMPMVPVIPQTRTLCSIGFERDKRRPARVDNEAKACLDDIALTMSAQADAHIEMIGNAAPTEDPQMAAERALNARQYLTQEKGVDPSRIEVRVGQTSGRTLDNVLVPSGATFNDVNTQLFDEASISRHGEAYGIHKGTGTHPAYRGTSRTHITHPRRNIHRRTGKASTFSTMEAPATNSGAPVTTIPPLQ
ncbi:MAG: outer membrane beta-barrel protein [Acidobacteriaceae bacterium]|nr:outer membrane beta-barrel protein [Acidobacteriaceae bacterium]